LERAKNPLLLGLLSSGTQTAAFTCLLGLICGSFLVGTGNDWNILLSCKRLSLHILWAISAFMFSYLFLGTRNKTRGQLLIPFFTVFTVLTAVCNSILPVCLSIIFVVISYSIGARLLSIPFRFETFPLCVLAGLIVVSTITLLFGLVGYISLPLVSATQIALMMLGRRQLKEMFSGLALWAISPTDSFHRSRTGRILISLVPAMTVGVLVTALGPTLGYDAFTTHFSLIKQVSESGSFYLDPAWNSFTAAHQGGHMIRVALFSILGEPLANLGDTVFLFILTFGVFSFSRVYFGVATSLISLLLLVSFPLTQHIANLTYFNFENTSYLFFATWLLFEPETLSLNKRKGFLAGCTFAAFALAVRPDSLLYLAALTPVLFLKLLKEGSFLKSILEGLVITVLVSGFYYFHAWNLTGNPLYPAPIGDVFSSTPYVPIQAEQKVGATENPRFAWPRSLNGLLNLPGRLTLSGSQFVESHNFVLGLWLPMLFPFALAGLYFMFRKRPWMAVVPLLAVALWLFSSMVYLRYIYPVVPLMVIATSFGLTSLLSKHLGSTLFCSLLTLTALPQLVMNHPAAGYPFGFPLPYASGKEDPDKLLRRQVFSLPLIRHLNESQTPDLKVFGVGAIFKYHADFPFYTRFRAEDHWQEFDSCKSEKCYEDFFKRHHFSHILTNWSRANRHKNYDILANYLRTSSTELMPTVDSKNRVELFQIGH